MTTSHALEAKYEAEDKEIKSETESTNLEKLPNPTGWRLLVMPFAVKEKTEGGIIIAQETLDRPWCKEKQWVIFARYAGSRMEIDGGEIRLLNDDEVLGTIDDPNDILHAF
jgi:co-chaperonin GroES (HSP10)